MVVLFIDVVNIVVLMELDLGIFEGLFAHTQASKNPHIHPASAIPVSGRSSFAQNNPLKFYNVLIRN